MTPYSARVLDKVRYQPGAWHGLRVGIFRHDGESEEQIGEYERNHTALYRTFAPFWLDGRDLALYSPDYTCTRVLELPSCRDIGGESPASDGFCPVDFFVPHYIELEVRIDGKPPRRYLKQLPTPEELTSRTIPVHWPATAKRPVRVVEEHYAPVGPLSYHPFGFVAGCLWGDDRSWKVQYLDLSQASSGIVRREERFGYIELAAGVTLDQAIDLSNDARRVRIKLDKEFHLRDGRPVDPFE